MLITNTFRPLDLVLILFPAIFLGLIPGTSLVEDYSTVDKIEKYWI